MKILIAGAGSIGSVLGVLLSFEHEVTLMRRKDAGEMEVKVTGAVETYARLPVVASCPFPQSLVIVSCQSQHTQSILPQLDMAVDSGTIILSLQNGVDNLDLLKQKFPKNRVYAGLVWWSATLIRPDLVYYHRSAPTVIDSASGLCEVLHRFNCEESDEIRNEMYRKLVLNVVSPALALRKLPYPQGLHEKAVRDLTRLMFEEACVILSSKGINLESHRLRKFHRILQGDIPDATVGKYTHKVSTQIGLEKYGGSDSNVRTLLGKLLEMDDDGVGIVLHQVHDLVLSLDRSYNPVDPDTLQSIANSGLSHDISVILG